ncbi:reverse transcriptase domain-containing protein [Tanacetum coccineum]
MYPPTTSESSARDSSSESSAGPSHKRCRSHAAIVTSSIHAISALVPSRADLLLPCKRFRDSISPEDSVEEDVDTDVLEDIKADATVNKVAVDKDVEAEVDASIGIEVDVGVDVEDEVEDEVGSSDRGTIEVGVDVVTGIDIPDGMLMPDAVEHLEQKEFEGRSLIDGGERASLLKQVASLERSNARLQGTMMLERARADRFRRRISFMESELRLVNMTITHSGMTLEEIEELVNRRVEEALAAYEATRAANAFEDESQSQNGSNGDNGNGGDGNGRDGNGENGNGGNGNPNENNREGVVGLIRWFEKMETVFYISNCPEKYQRELMKLMAEVYCPRNEIQKMESELWNLTVKNNDLAAYTQRFQELTMMCTKMVPEEEDRVEKSIGGLPDNIQGNVIAAEPIRLQDDVRIANNLMDQKLKRYAVKNAENKTRAYTAGNNEKRGYVGPLPYCNKCKLHHEGPCTVKCGKCNKVAHMARDCKNAVVVPTTQRALVWIFIKKDKNKAKRTKPSTGMERVQEIKAKGVYVLNGPTLWIEGTRLKVGDASMLLDPSSKGYIRRPPHTEKIV